MNLAEWQQAHKAMGADIREAKREAARQAAGGKGRWERIRGTAIVFGVLGLVATGALIWVLIMIGAPSGDAAWGLYGAALGYFAGAADKYIHIASIRADERKPTMTEEAALRFAEMEKKKQAVDYSTPAEQQELME